MAEQALTKEQQLAALDLEVLETSVEIDKLHKHIGNLYLANNHKAMVAHIPHLTRRWDILARLLIQRGKIVDPDPVIPRQTPKPAPFDYTRLGDDYN